MVELDDITPCDWLIRNEITIDSSLQTVWRYINDPEKLSTWWCPPPMDVEVDFDPVVDGSYVERFSDGDHQYELFGWIASYDPEENLTIVRETCDCFGDFDVIELQLNSEAERTKVILRQAFPEIDNEKREEAIDFYAGWRESLHCLMNLIEAIDDQ